MARASVLMRVEEVREASAGQLRKAGPCVMVIFGGSGDLTRRKLMPSLFHLMQDGLLADDFAIIGVDREPQSDQDYQAAIHDAMVEFKPGGHELEEGDWEKFSPHLSHIKGELNDPGTYKKIGDRLGELGKGFGENGGHLFYLAIPPSLYPVVIEQLAASGIAPRVPDAATKPWVRVIIEKPFGRSLQSALDLNACVRKAFAEHQVYRIDHYLGKETVQNLLVLRFANSIFEPVWNRQHIQHVQITAAESVGVEHRARYYEEAGVVRDMFQNHLLQLLTLTAMEPPVTFSADAVRDEKVKVLKALRPTDKDEWHEFAVRGQYGPGTIDGQKVPGYREEEGVAPNSPTPTYAALRFMVDNWRWQGVPFYLRSAKRMPRRVTEIAITFREPPHLMFKSPKGLEPNVLAVRVQPKEAIALRFEVKLPGVDVKMLPVDMDFEYADAFGSSDHDAYETLLLDCMLGEATLFTRSDEVEAAWRAVDPLIDHWEHTAPAHFPNYAAGSWGPEIADAFIGRIGVKWRQPKG
ncbi:MAG TPA: glucose-6-phosphate dehydrogenase [Gemmatimonadales bacterium]|jgi:glucose-6-phosphate 1-dehydrogenase